MEYSKLPTIPDFDMPNISGDFSYHTKNVRKAWIYLLIIRIAISVFIIVWGIAICVVHTKGDEASKKNVEFTHKTPKAR